MDISLAMSILMMVLRNTQIIVKTSSGTVNGIYYNVYYNALEQDYVKVIKQYFNNFQSEFMSEPDKYDFDSSCITEGDYYYRKEEGGGYDVGLYDLESHTLYYIHDN